MKIQTCFPEFLNVTTNVVYISFAGNKNQINFYKRAIIAIFILILNKKFIQGSQGKEHECFQELIPAFRCIFLFLKKKQKGFSLLSGLKHTKNDQQKSKRCTNRTSRN